jgi:hypothetical protein
MASTLPAQSTTDLGYSQKPSFRIISINLSSAILRVGFIGRLGLGIGFLAPGLPGFFLAFIGDRR